MVPKRSTKRPLRTFQNTYWYFFFFDCQNDCRALLVLTGWKGLPWWISGKESACNGAGSIPGLGRSPGEGNSYPILYSGLEDSTDSTVSGVAKSRTRLSGFHFHFLMMDTEMGRDLSTLQGAVGPQAHPLPTAGPQVLHLQRKEDATQLRSGRF